MLEGIVRVNLLLVKTTPSSSLMEFFVNKTDEMQEAVSSALRFVQVFTEDLDPKASRTKLPWRGKLLLLLFRHSHSSS